MRRLRLLALMAALVALWLLGRGRTEPTWWLAFLVALFGLACAWAATDAWKETPRDALGLLNLGVAGIVALIAFVKMVIDLVR